MSRRSDSSTTKNNNNANNNSHRSLNENKNNGSKTSKSSKLDSQDDMASLSALEKKLSKSHRQSRQLGTNSVNQLDDDECDELYSCMILSDEEGDDNDSDEGYYDSESKDFSSNHDDDQQQHTVQQQFTSIAKRKSVQDSIIEEDELEQTTTSIVTAHSDATDHVQNTSNERDIATAQSIDQLQQQQQTDNNDGIPDISQLVSCGTNDDDDANNKNNASFDNNTNINNNNSKHNIRSPKSPRWNIRSRSINKRAVVSDDITTSLSTPSLFPQRARSKSQQSATPNSRHLLRYLRSWGSKDSSQLLFSDSISSSAPALLGPNNHATIDTQPDAPPAINAGELPSVSLRSFDLEDAVDGNNSSSSSDTLSDDESEATTDSSLWSDDSLNDYNNNANVDIDWDLLPALPAQFDTSNEIDDNDNDNINNVNGSVFVDNDLLRRPILYDEANKFALQHSVMLQAVLQLLAERDQVGVEDSMDSADNILKKGPLKKRSTAVGRHRASTWWKVKYVELRRGNLCYYEDSGEGRKIIHLRQSDTIVRATETRGPGFVFELIVQGSPPRFWSVSSDEERQAWIRAIRAAMIGEDGDDGYRRDLDVRPHQKAIDIYLSVRNELADTDLTDVYLMALSDLLEQHYTLQLPLQWILEKFQPTTTDVSHMSLKHMKINHLSPHKRIRRSIQDFWASVSETTFAINGVILPRLTPLASERILGALTRCIIEYDKAYHCHMEEEAGVNMSNSASITSSQAVSYARDIIMSVLRRKDQNELTAVVSHFLNNPHLVQIVAQTQEEPVHLEVSFAGHDLPDDIPHIGNEVAGWLRTRRRQFTGNKWKARYAVLSGAVLSYYEAADPHPHGLRGQIVLSGATLQEESPEGDEQYVICVVVSDEKRLFSFKNKDDYMEWKTAIQTAIDSCASLAEESPVAQDVKTNSKSILMKGIKVAIPDASLRGGIRAIKGATGGGFKVIKSATDGGMKAIRGAVGMLLSKPSGETSGFGMQRRPSMQMLMNPTNLNGGGKRDPTVQCVVKMTQTFVVREISEYDNGSQLLSVRAKIFQAFLLSGGSGGRVARGDALVEIDLFESITSGKDQDDVHPSWYFR